MKKKLFGGAILIALISAALTLGLVCLLLGLNSGNALDLGRFFVALRFIEGNYVQEVSRRQLIDGAINGMVNSLGDPHSVYLAPQLYSQLRAETSGAFGGIGVYMGFKNGVVQVMSVIPDSPGQRAGLQAGDEILAVDGKPVEEISPSEVALKIRGEIGTPVELLIHREGFEDTVYNLTREIIKDKSVAGKMIDERLAYIKIASFSESTSDEFKATLAELESAGMKGFVLDMRQNPGGVINGCIEIGQEIVPKGTITSVIKRDGSKEVYTSDLPAAKFPIVVLIDENSASAAELLAGALQDTKAAIVVGETSYGKGSVQTLIPMAHDDGLKLTIAKYYTPNGKCIDGLGVTPDVEIISPAAPHPMYDLNLDTQDDLQLAKAEELLRHQVDAGKILFDDDFWKTDAVSLQ
ncbi:MAG: S41 family peptidase [Selenomonadaceae bacterium]|nr:S41 family peptidase [Selenomonadaceae bacterium]MBQ3726965.1 S41 family peptidase [Selenomonadaceae bacterium]